MTGKRSLVSVVDDDESVRESLPDLLRQFGFAAEAFPSAEAFLASDVFGETSCLLLDIAMPGMSGPDLQQELARRRQKIPIVFITGLGDGSLRPRLLARGAVECLVKPFSEAALLDAVRAALRRPHSGARDGDVSSPGEARSESMARVISHDTPVVFVVDDDVSVRESLELLILSAGWRPETFESAEEFLERSRIDGPSCLVLDVTLPNLNGLDLQKRIIDRADMPIIFITGYGDVPTTVQAMKAGAVEFLTKPFGDDVLLNATRQAIERSRAALAHEVELRALRHAARTTDHGIGRHRPVEQTDRSQARYQRDHGEGPPGPGYAEDASRFPRRTGESRRSTRPAAGRAPLIPKYRPTLSCNRSRSRTRISLIASS